MSDNDTKQTVDELLDDLTSEPRTLHVVYRGMDNLRIVSPEDEPWVAYEIQECRDGQWETEARLTGKQALAVHGMFNKKEEDG